jgi:hypothetical protein
MQAGFPSRKAEMANMMFQAVESVSRSKEDIRLSIKNPDIAWLLATSAAKTCDAFLATYRAADAITDEDFRRYESGRLLFVLAAMEGGNEYDTLEALRVMGTRNVDTQGRPRKARYKKAGEARHRPVTDPRHYDRGGHLARMEQRVAGELHALMVQPERLEQALEANGAIAVAKYI